MKAPIIMTATGMRNYWYRFSRLNIVKMPSLLSDVLSPLYMYMYK